MDVKRINDFVRNLDSAINITGITVYGVDDEGHSVKIDTEMLTNPKPTFTEASTRTNIVGNGESTTTLWGKVKKWFSDLKTVAFSGSYNDLNNKPEIKKVATTGVFSDLIDKNVSTGTVAFTEASSRTNIATGESQSTLWGKIKKWFTDLKAVAFSGSFADLNNKEVGSGTVTFTPDTSAVRVNIASGETLSQMFKVINANLGVIPNTFSVTWMNGFSGNVDTLQYGHLFYLNVRFSNNGNVGINSRILEINVTPTYASYKCFNAMGSTKSILLFLGKQNEKLILYLGQAFTAQDSYIASTIFLL